jgi:hypothetical protein
VRVTHPFHPLFGRELEFVKRRRNWRADRVYVFDPNGLLLSLPVEWTDVVAEDPFMVVAAGRSPFHTAGTNMCREQRKAHMPGPDVFSVINRVAMTHLYDHPAVVHHHDSSRPAT